MLLLVSHCSSTSTKNTSTSTYSFLAKDRIRPFVYSKKKGPRVLENEIIGDKDDAMAKMCQQPYSLTTSQPFFLVVSYSFRFVSFRLISLHFISFHFISFHFIPFHFISFVSWPSFSTRPYPREGYTRKWGAEDMALGRGEPLFVVPSTLRPCKMDLVDKRFASPQYDRIVAFINENEVASPRVALYEIHCTNVERAAQRSAAHSQLIAAGRAGQLTVNGLTPHTTALHGDEDEAVEQQPKTKLPIVSQSFPSFIAAEASFSRRLAINVNSRLPNRLARIGCRRYFATPRRGYTRILKCVTKFEKTYLLLKKPMEPQKLISFFPPFFSSFLSNSNRLVHLRVHNKSSRPRFDSLT